MCKILVIPSIKKSNVENAWKLCKEIAPLMSRIDDDGFGFAAMDSSGNLLGERWLNSKLAMTDNCGLTLSDVKVLKTMGPKLVKESFEYNKFGDLKNKKDIVSIMLHARKATTPKGLINTHPFVKNDTAIIHNGMISNHERLTKEFSTCDSEAILHEYLEYNAAHNPKQVQEMVNNLDGYYAVGVMSKNENNIPIVDVFKSQAANLICTYVDEIESVVFCTAQHLIVDALETLKWNKNKIFEFADTGFIRFNALTGERIHSEILTKVVSHNTFLDRQKKNNRQKDMDDIIQEYGDQVEIDYVALIEADERQRVEDQMARAYGVTI